MGSNTDQEKDGKTIEIARDPKTDWYRLWLFIIVGLTFAAIVWIVSAGAGITEYKDWVSFLTVNIVSVLAFDMVLISALTSRETVEVMRHQEQEMTRQRQITDEQLKAMRESVAQTKALFELTERPLLGVERIICEPIKDGGCEIIIALINSGKTMAKIANLSIAHSSVYPFLEDIDDIDSDNLGNDLTLREPGEPEEYLTSGIIHNGGRKLIPYMTMNAGAWDNINKEGSEQIYIWLKVQYTGINRGDVYFTEYYGYYNRFMGGFIECSNYNDAS